ncbi:cupin domain-containing protein [Trichlorobacter ammonificans]|uniref:Cupin_5 domain-containing protein n=1 Tax=Trichlorobacter ammonificans TaxID=2916410 RepID=A0ABN8HEC9_9BACT|nr:cupin domain-containing protein [Trichlorobacter ammonificans]CAH2030246.1 Cupin_5 domain-containing protein [Trichlorobacter ammonificans]
MEQPDRNCQPGAADLIRTLDLARHPEGGWFRETYRCAELLPAAALPARFDGPRSCCTAILFLLEPGEFSALHRIRSDELWHFHLGGALTIHMLLPDGRYLARTLGSDLCAGEALQVAVPAGAWFGAEPDGNAPYTLVGCTVAPGFEFADFELADGPLLARQLPAHEGIIRRLTRS